MTRSALVLVCLAGLALGLPAAPQAAATQQAVLVTGASSGIGLLISRRLVEEGFYVYAGARDDADLARLDAMQNVSSLRLDVTVQRDIDAAVAFIAAGRRGLFAVVNNAGIASVATLDTVPDEDVLRIHDVNVMGPLRINRAFLPMLTESGGRTVVIGSLSAFVAAPSGGAYAMSKIAVEAYSATLAAELVDRGVGVGIVEPGAFRSRAREKVAMHMLTGSPDFDQQLDAEQAAVLADVAAANRALDAPHAVADAVLDFLTSDTPRLRYMVAPDERTADLAVREALRIAVQLNAGQEFAKSRDEMIALLETLYSEATLAEPRG